MKKLQTLLASKDAFSIIEVIVALAVSSIIMIMIYSAHHAIIKTIRDLTGVAEFHESVNIAIRRIDRDLTGMYINKDNKFIKFSIENRQSGAKLGWASFVTINPHGKVIHGDASSESHETDIKSVKYFLRPDPKIEGLYLLMREEKNLYETKTEDESSKPDEITSFESLLLENVVDLSFECTSDTQWDARWQNPDQAPRAVRVTLRVRNYRGVDENFIFIAIPSMGKGQSG
ncbi:MAG TPA: type II secretion system protein GspJ [Spirochaetota bacterium]